jgi:hypothetical protein
MAPENFSGTDSLCRSRSTSSLAMSVPSYTSKVLRARYGVLCKKPYNPHIHYDSDLIVDLFDGQVFAVNQIDWLLKKVTSRSVRPLPINN